MINRILPLIMGASLVGLVAGCSSSEPYATQYPAASGNAPPPYSYENGTAAMPHNGIGATSSSGSHCPSGAKPSTADEGSTSPIGAAC